MYIIKKSFKKDIADLLCIKYYFFKTLFY